MESKVYYHGTESYRIATIRMLGLTPQPVPEFVRDIVKIDKGVYLSLDREFIEDFVSFHYDDGVVIELTVPNEGRLIPDPELGEELPEGFIYPDIIPPKYLKLEGKSNPTGTCYQDAWRFLAKQDEGFLIHGSTQLSAEGSRVNHAWVELTTGWIWEPQTGQYFLIEDFQVMNPEEHYRYTSEEAAIMIARTNNMGPWTDEERAQWLQADVKVIPAVGEYPARKGIIPKLPEEARGDILFFEFIRDLSRYEALSEEDVQRHWEGYRR